MIRGTLCTGDYSLQGYEDKIRLERKSLQDLIMCVGRERKRFERELERLKKYEYRSIICEGSWSAIRLKQYRGQMNPNSIASSIRAWSMRGTTVFMMGTRAAAQEECIKQLELAHRSLTRSDLEKEDKSTEQASPVANQDAQNS